MTPLSWNCVISSSVLPRIRNRLRVASSATCAVRRSFCAAWLAASAVCRSRSGPALLSNSLRFWPSTIWARLSAARALFSEAMAAMKSFFACTMSVASTVNRGWPAVTMSPGFENLDDASRIGREHQRRAILVDGELAFGDVLGAEHLADHRLDGERRPLGLGRTIQAVRAARLAGDFGLGNGDLLRVLGIDDERDGADAEQQNAHEHRVPEAQLRPSQQMWPEGLLEHDNPLPVGLQLLRIYQYGSSKNNWVKV